MKNRLPTLLILTICLLLCSFAADETQALASAAAPIAAPAATSSPEATATPAPAETSKDYADAIDLSNAPAILKAVQKALDSEETSFAGEALCKIEQLSITGVRVRDLAPLSTFAGLKSLDLSGSTGFTEVSALAELKTLVELNLSGTRVDDISALSAMAGLQTLNLSRARVTDLSPLSALSNLRTLDIGGGNVRDLAPVAELTNLESLSIDKPNFRHTDLEVLSGLKNLRALDLTGNTVTDLSFVSGMAHLETLTLSGNRKLADVEKLENCENLRTLYLYNTIVSREDREELVKAVPKLTVFWTKDGGAYPTRNPKGLLLTGAGKEQMGDVLKSDTLVLDGVTKLELKPLVAAIKICMPELKHLTLSNCDLTVITPLEELTGLVTIDLSGNEMTSLKPLANLDALEKVTAADCEKLTGGAVGWLSAKRPGLTIDRGE